MQTARLLAAMAMLLAPAWHVSAALAEDRAPRQSAATLFMLDPACDKFDPASGVYVRDADPGKGQPCDVAGRRPVSRAPGNAPASMVGELYNGPYKSTAFFVGKCHIVTNCHAAFLDVVHPSSNQKSTFAFGQNPKITDLFAEHVQATPVVWGSCGCAATERTGENDCSVEQGAQDWALLKLEDCEGDGYAAKYGYALLDPARVIDPATKQPDPKFAALKLHALGEPATLNLSGQPGKPGVNDYMQGAWESAPCAIKGADSGIFFHSCPDVPGDSGGPIGFQDDRGILHVVAIQRGMGTSEDPAEPLGKWDFRNANKAVAVSNFYDKVIEYIRADQDALRK